MIFVEGNETNKAEKNERGRMYRRFCCEILFVRFFAVFVHDEGAHRIRHAVQLLENAPPILLGAHKCCC